MNIFNEVKGVNVMDEYRKMVVIFVDLLGTKNNVRFKDKYFIHRLFHEEVKINEERNLSHVIYDRKVYSFSDCVYFLYYYKDGVEENRKDDMKLLQIAMYNTSISLLRVLNAGYLLRGGISFGDAYFDELGFFGPAVEEAYRLESNYADMPIVAISPELGKKFYKWEEMITDMNVVNLLMTSRPLLVERENEKYFLNIFYQLEYTFKMRLEYDSIELDEVKQNLRHIILRDKEKYRDQKISEKTKKATVYEKLDWLERYLEKKYSRLKPELVEGAFCGVIADE